MMWKGTGFFMQKIYRGYPLYGRIPDVTGTGMDEDMTFYGRTGETAEQTAETASEPAASSGRQNMQGEMAYEAADLKEVPAPGESVVRQEAQGIRDEAWKETGVNLDLIYGSEPDQTVQDTGTGAAASEPYMVYRKDSQPGEERVHSTEMELDYFKSLYPASMKKRQVLVDEVCDRMDYAGSPIYDEYPDRISVTRMRDHICRNAGEQGMGEEQDLTQVLLVNEIGRRRILRKN